MTARLPIHLLLSRPGPVSECTSDYPFIPCRAEDSQPGGQDVDLRGGEAAFKEVAGRFNKPENERGRRHMQILLILLHMLSLI